MIFFDTCSWCPILQHKILQFKNWNIDPRRNFLRFSTLEQFWITIFNREWNFDDKYFLRLPSFAVSKFVVVCLSLEVLSGTRGKYECKNYVTEILMCVVCRISNWKFIRKHFGQSRSGTKNASWSTIELLKLIFQNLIPFVFDALCVPTARSTFHFFCIHIPHIYKILSEFLTVQNVNSLENNISFEVVGFE